MSTFLILLSTEEGGAQSYWLVVSNVLHFERQLMIQIAIPLDEDELRCDELWMSKTTNVKVPE